MAEAQLRTFMYEYIHRSPNKRSRGVQASNSPLKTIEPKTHNLNPSIEFRQISAHTNMYSPISTSPSKPVKAIEVGTETTDEIIDYVTGKVVKRRAEKSLDKIMYTNHLKFKTLQEAVEDIKNIDKSNRLLKHKIDNIRDYVVKRMDSMHKRPKGSLKRLLFEPKYSPERKDRSESAFVGRKTKDTFLGDPFFRTNHSGRKMTERARSTVRSVNSFDMNSGNKLAKTSTDWK